MDNRPATSVSEQTALRRLLLFAGLLSVLYVVMAVMSSRFAYGTPVSVRPVRLFVGLMLATFILHLIALKSAVQLHSLPSVCKWILWFGLGFRLILLASHPIQEIDIYRYMWDGRVVAEGSSPYLFSPQNVLDASEQSADPRLRALVSLRERSPPTHTALRRIHFKHLTTIYPPVSQFVFATAAAVVPENAPLRVYVIVTKLFIVMFDVLAMLGVLRLLRQFNKPDGWLICYAWSPLILKEFSNSGHLDAIAIGLTIWAVVWWVEALQTKSAAKLMIAAATLGLGVGAKLYPIVVVPVITISVARHFGVRRMLESGIVFSLVTASTLWPMLSTKPADVAVIDTVPSAMEPGPETSIEIESEIAAAPHDSPPLPDDYAEVIETAALKDFETPPSPIATDNIASQPSGDGLNAFMEMWKMNDLFFLIIEENLIPNSAAWFSFVPDAEKWKIVKPLSARLNRTPIQTAFLITRFATASLHLLIVLWLAAKAWKATETELLNLAFLSLAWFWLLLPTLNPWYWIWAMPLLPFARLRSWLLLSGCVSIYYIRFWLRESFPDQPTLGTPYAGAAFFTFVVVWFEYIPFLACLAFEFFNNRRQTSDPG